MSTPPVVPMFDPQGIARDIPYEQMKEALAHGAKPGVRMQAPDGSVRIVPADKTQEAAGRGGKILPIEDQATDHPGFWHAVMEDAPSLAKGIVKSVMLGPPGMAYQGIQQGIAEFNSLKSTGKTVEQTQSDQQKAAGYGPMYRNVATPLAQGVGVNVPGMEQSAAQGDVGGVMGHAAVPAAAAVAPIVGEAGLNAAKVIVPPVVRGTAKATNTVLAKAPGVVGASVGAAAGHATGIPGGGEIGAGIGYLAGKKISTVRVPGERFGLPPEIKPAIPPTPAPSNVGEFLSQGANKNEAALSSYNKTANALEQSRPLGEIHTVIDKVIPPEGVTKGANLRTKAEVQFYLDKGNVESAQAALAKAADKPGAWPPKEARTPIRYDANAAKGASGPGPSFDLKGITSEIGEDNAIKDAMQNYVDRQGQIARTQAGREFAAKNSMDMPKGQMGQSFKNTQIGPGLADIGTPNVGSPVEPVEMLNGNKIFKQDGTWFIQSGKSWNKISNADLRAVLRAKESAGPDLTGILQKSVEQARARKVSY